MSILLIILLLYVLDITLTHYQFYVLKKYGILNMKFERNIIPRLFLRNNPSPLNYLVMCFVLCPSLIGFLIFVSMIDVMPIYAVLGMILMVNIYHVENLRILKANSGDPNYFCYVKNKKYP